MFMNAYLGAIERQRTDVLTVFIHLLGMEWYINQIADCCSHKYYVLSMPMLEQAGAVGRKHEIALSKTLLNAPHFPVVYMDLEVYRAAVVAERPELEIEPLWMSYQIRNTKLAQYPRTRQRDLTFFEEFIAEGFPRTDDPSADMYSFLLTELGWQLLHLGQIDEAQQALSLALRMEPTTSSARQAIETSLASIHLWQGPPAPPQARAAE